MFGKIACAMLAMFGLITQAQAAYPEKPIRMIVVSAPGSGGDALGRILAEYMAQELKGNIVVENKPGAGGAVGMDYLAHAEPDGYTFGIGSNSTHILIPIINKRINYNPLKDFTPVASVGSAQTLLIAGADFPADNVQDLIKLAKSSKEAVQYASWGNGSSGHFCGALLAYSAKIDLMHIPYKSVSQIQSDMLGGHINLAFVDMGSGLTMLKGGKVKALASCTERTAQLPNVPGYADSKLDVADVKYPVPRWAMYLPKGAPQSVVNRLAAALKAALDQPKVKEFMDTQGVTPVLIKGDVLGKMNAEDIAFWEQIAKVANIKDE